MATYAGATRSEKTMSTPANRTELVTVAANETKKSVSFQNPFMRGYKKTRISPRRA